MKRKSFKLLLPLIIATSIVLSGCGSNNAQDETVTENAEVETTISDVSGDVTNIVETSDEAEEEVVEEAVADSSEEVMEEQVAEVPNDNASSEPVATTPAENKPEETVPTAETPAPVITDPANDPTAPTGDIPATVTWTYTTFIVDPVDWSRHAETFTVTTRNPGLHSVEYYQAHPWKLYNEENTDELGTISFIGLDSSYAGDAWGALYYQGVMWGLDDSYLYDFTIKTYADWEAVETYQVHHINY